MTRPAFPLWCVGLSVLLLPSGTRAAAEQRPLEVHLDATEAPRRLLHARLVIPAAPGPLTLYYPKWIPGEHAPNGPIADLAGLTIRAAGKPVTWQRDDIDLYAFHCTVPDGADRIEVALDYLAPSPKDGYTPAPLASLALLNWHAVLLYPKGRSVRDLQVRADLTLPKVGSLRRAGRRGDPRSAHAVPHRAARNAHRFSRAVWCMSRNPTRRPGRSASLPGPGSTVPAVWKSLRP